MFELSGGRLCLDFANTVDKRPTRDARDLLSAYADLASWSTQSGILSSADEKRLRRQAEQRLGEARTALAHARSLRETIFHLFCAIAEGRSPAKHLASLEPELAGAFRDPAVRPYELIWRDDAQKLDGMLGPVVRSTVELLTSRDRDRVRICAADSCAWLFLDTSRNRSRRWCDMTVCGNRAKAKRHYQRQRSRQRRRNPSALPSAG